MAEMELYHIHKKNAQDKKWKEQSIIKVDENFNSVMNQRQQNFSQTMIIDHGERKKINYSIYLAYYLNKIKDLKIIKREDLDELKRLLEIGYDMACHADFFKRETALETCRKNHFSDIPSRLHSIYLCDQDGLEYWSDIISKNNSEEIEIFRVLATGKIFKTNEQLLPDELLEYEQAYKSAFQYWNPKFKNIPNFTNEYLAQGNIKVLEKLK